MDTMADLILPAATSLPRWPTSLLGRDVERKFARTCRLETTGPLLTLTGPGGVGKTRLALAIAEDAREHFADGLIWVDLAPLADPNAVTMAVISALGITPYPQRPVLTTLTREFFMPRFPERDEGERAEPIELYPWDGVSNLRLLSSLQTSVAVGVY